MNQKGFTLIELLIVMFVLFIIVGGGYGWIQNLMIVYHSTFNYPLTVELALRFIGVIFVPIGMIMGYIH